MPGKAFDPKDKIFKQRLNAFLDDVKKNYGLTISQDNGRTREWQQKHHVAHMFLYNAYKSAKPANTDNGKRTISWSHFSDPKITWKTVKFSDFLKTKENTRPIKEGNKYNWG